MEGEEALARARDYLKDDQLLEAAWALDALATKLGDDVLIARTSLAVGRTRRVERQALDGLATHDQIGADRDRISLSLSALRARRAPRRASAS